MTWPCTTLGDILDRGDHVDEDPHPPVVIPAAEWPSYSGERFPAEAAAWQERIDQDAELS